MTQSSMKKIGSSLVLMLDTGGQGKPIKRLAKRKVRVTTVKQGIPKYT